MRPNHWLILGMLLLAGCAYDSPQTNGAAADEVDRAAR